ncbi:MAG: hypothetical protein IAA31_02845 [Candidatus Anaerobiospirillum merdipullorum]|uniref:Uncharacterized protein n=1 Tax=Candidatus Anaerobiospirillum merdipullorum TaxID=2838450 RepID=A0A9E2KN42_9GAMM|nr:hypothetical protein [Candidatus Anaerobiospirillum merdipullorum]
MELNLRTMATFGVAGNFTGHLEQAGEARDFKNVQTAEANAPKALFPTFIPQGGDSVPAYLKVFPFDAYRVIFPDGQQNLQIEPEMAIVCEVSWQDGQVTALKPVAFGASNDCSIRKEGARKISEKKNWGPSSKGFATNVLKIDSFAPGGILDKYRIASFLVRDGEVYEYGEDSAVRDYSYFYDKLLAWCIDKLNHQQDTGPAEHINAYLQEAGCPQQILISVGATRYTPFGESHYLQKGDQAVVVVYPEDVYSKEEIAHRVKRDNLEEDDISVLQQMIV